MRGNLFKHTENISNVNVVLKSFHRTENILMRATLLSGWNEGGGGTCIVTVPHG